MSLLVGVRRLRARVEGQLHEGQVEPAAEFGADLRHLPGDAETGALVQAAASRNTKPVTMEVDYVRVYSGNP